MVQHADTVQPTCNNCYIESSPQNDRLVYLSAGEVGEYLDEMERDGLGTELIGFTGGEPFMDPDLPAAPPVAVTEAQDRPPDRHAICGWKRSGHVMVEAPISEKLTGPMLVFGGPTAIWRQQRPVLDEAGRRGIPPGNIVCTGDLAVYCADPQAVIDLLHRSGIRIVMGNCEEALAAQAAFLPVRSCQCVT